MQTDIPFYFRKPPVHQHFECNNFDEERGRCTDRGVRLSKKDLACKNIDLKVASKYIKFQCQKCLDMSELVHTESVVIKLDSGKTTYARIYKCVTCDTHNIIYQTEDSQIVLPLDG